MNRPGQSGSFGGRRSKREPIELREPKREDKSIDMLISVRKNRVSRFERELSQAREEWREARTGLREAKLKWREAVEAAREEWRAAREQFFRMNTTSGQFRTAKAIYDRMKAQASQLHLEAKQSAQTCRDLGRNFFEAKKRLAEVRRQQEKLSMLRDELRALNNQGME